MTKRILLVLILILALFSCKKQDTSDNKIYIFHAGSLSVPFKEMEDEFEKKYPQYDILRESSGSRNAARKISDLGKRCEIMASADYTVVDTLLVKENHADWNIKFVANEMAIMYTPNSRYKDEINSDNWFDILLKKEVEYGHSEPEADPCGYRTLLVWQLAEKFYNQEGLYKNLNDGCPQKNIRSAEVDLIALLEAGQLDYLFIYRSVAEQHKMPYVVLPDNINLKTEKYIDFYKTASLELTGATPGEKITVFGEPMIYSFTIPNNAENKKGALLFAQFILSESGKTIMEQNGQPFMNPPEISGDLKKVPSELTKIIASYK